MATKFKRLERVVLAENPNYAGSVSDVFEKGVYDASITENMYHVQWDRFGKYLYTEAALLSEAEAKKLAKIELQSVQR